MRIITMTTKKKFIKNKNKKYIYCTGTLPIIKNKNK